MGLFKHVLLSPKHPRNLSEVTVSNLAYSLWKRIWLETFQELTGEQTIKSDTFLSHEEISCLLFKENIVGLVLHNFIDLRLLAQKDHSYFKCYPESVVKQIETGHPKKMIMSNLTLSPEFRRSNTSIPLADVLIGLTIERFKSSGRDELVSYTHNKRKINDLVYRFGAKPLDQNQRAHNTDVDFIVINKNQIKTSPIPGVQPLIDDLFYQNVRRQNERSTSISPKDGYNEYQHRKLPLEL